MKPLVRWCLALALLLVTSHASADARERSIAAGRFALEIDGVSAGFAVGASGKTIDRMTSDRKTTLEHARVTIDVGMGLSDALTTTISKSLRDGGYTTTIRIARDAEKGATFHDALITELTFPAMDASSKDPGYLSVELRAERAEVAKPPPKLAARASAEAKQKLWTPSNFRVEIDDLPCDRVSKIDSFTLEQSVVEDGSKQPTKLEIPNLKITFSAADAGAWKKWLAQRNAKSGQIILQSRRGAALLRVKLRGTRLASLRPIPGTRNVLAIVEVETITLRR